MPTSLPLLPWYVSYTQFFDVRSSGDAATAASKTHIDCNKNSKDDDDAQNNKEEHS